MTIWNKNILTAYIFQVPEKFKLRVQHELEAFPLSVQSSVHKSLLMTI